jgi:glycosyltransferase involved in cell wall biosynthesis
MTARGLRVLLMMDPLIPVPPVHYGGIERVIADLGNGLATRGHQVTLWAAPGSRISGTVVPFGREGEWTRWSNVRNTAAVTTRLWGQRRDFDVVHNFGRLAYLSGALAMDLPKVQTYMRQVNPANMRKVRRLGARRLCFTGVSAAICRTGQPGGGDWRVVYNCASPSAYRFNARVDPERAPLVFLGRLERCKGAHTAIAAAKGAGRPLIIAGNISPLAHEREYFEREVQPFIDGRQIQYIGPVDDRQKNDLLGNAAAMLMPIEWEEPFPVVLPEAMLCGTPVIGFRRGGVPEGIDDGRTGFLCETAGEMVSAIHKLATLDRAACRKEAERRFSTDAVVTDYETIYRDLCQTS